MLKEKKVLTLPAWEHKNFAWQPYDFKEPLWRVESASC